MTQQTGWTGEAPEAGPAMPLTGTLLAMRHREPGDTLAIAMARSRAAEVREEREEAARAKDPDEYAAALVTRGYMPGMMSQLAMRLADVEAEAESERSKIEKGRQRQERVMAMHARGQVQAMDIPQMLGDDEGDAHRADQLERRAGRIRREMRDAAEAMTTPEHRQLDAVEEASSRAQRILAQVAGEQRAEDELQAAAQAQMSRDRAAFRASRRPFGSGDVAVRSEVTCQECVNAGATLEESQELHADRHEDAGELVSYR